jgi:hypothetical protein
MYFTAEDHEGRSLEQLKDRVIDFYAERDASQVPDETRKYIYIDVRDAQLPAKETWDFFTEVDEILAYVVKERRKDRGIYEYI